MIKEFLESLKLKDIVFFVLIIVLFCMYFKKNKKEKFSLDLSTRDKLKEQMAIALGDNFTAIKNLGDLASQITSSSAPGKLKLNELVINDGSGDYDILERIKSILATNVTQGAAIMTAKGRADAAYTLADTKTTFADLDTELDNYVKYDSDLIIQNRNATGHPRNSSQNAYLSTKISPHSFSNPYHNSLTWTTEGKSSKHIWHIRKKN